VTGPCRLANPSSGGIVVIADQFEEVFMFVTDEVLRNRSIHTPLAEFPDRTAGHQLDICLVLTTRAGFYGMTRRHWPLAEWSRINSIGGQILHTIIKMDFRLLSDGLEIDLSVNSDRPNLKLTS
jgi:hypothetical protein